MFQAAIQGDVEIVKYLLEMKVKVSAKAITGETAYDLAVKMNHEEVIKLLAPSSPPLPE